VAVPDPIPTERLTVGDFLADCDPSDLIYFLLNVGDGDSQLIVLPAESDGSRRAIVVDVATLGKLPGLVETLAARGMLTERAGLFPIVIGSHPHEDHIGGMGEFLERFGSSIHEYWEPGYYHPGPGYMRSMAALEMQPAIQHSQPTSGFTRFVGQVKVTVLAPAIGLRNNFDSYGVNINNASIALKIEFPASRVEQRDHERRYLRLRGTQALLLGADAQTASWGRVMADFPELRPRESPVAKALRMALGADPLKAQVFKVPHHASKHGVSLELVELVDPDLTLISSAGGGGKYNFPHTVAQESVREALEAMALRGGERSKDYDLGIHYTSESDAGGTALGSLAIVISPTGRKRHMWRFCDRPKELVDLGKARQYHPPARVKRERVPDSVPV
jgi:competence protein ComEC